MKEVIYHASNCPPVLERISTKNKQVLCFVDSDKPYHDGKRGGTYGGVNAAVKRERKHIAKFVGAYREESVNSSRKLSLIN